jgi:hypothetical protein
MTAPTIAAPAHPSGTDSPPAAAPAKRTVRNTLFFWAAVLAITALGACLRFWRLDYQAYWTDEGYTVYRVRGTFQFLLNQLADQGFPPGWYALVRLWRIFLELRLPIAETYQPQYLRMVSAFLGSLMVPVMCFLGRQFTDRKGALLVALFAAVNPFLVYYSRDLKMYAALYFFVALNMALFLQWLNSPRNLLWFPLFLLSGVVMTTMHDMAWVAPVLQILFLLLRRRPRPWDVPLWVLATAAAAAIPIYWHFVYTNPERWSIRLYSENNRGLSWITEYTDMSWQTAVSLPTAHVLGYLWPVYPPDQHPEDWQRLNDWFILGGRDFTDHLATRSWSWMAHGQLYAAYALFAILIVGLLPWRKIPWRKIFFLPRKAPAPRLNPPPRPVGTWWLVALWVLLPTLALAATWIPPEDPWYERLFFGHDHKPLWEPRYLGVIVPAWILWLAASLRRLPFWPVRTVAILAAVGVCGFASLSNHWVYRNPPLQRADAILLDYLDSKNMYATAVAVPPVHYPEPAVNVASAIARHVIPLSPEDSAYTPYPGGRDNTFWPLNLNSEAAVASWLRTTANNPRIKTIVLTDRYGDLADNPADILSDPQVAKLLGSRWTLVRSETYTWHYEWRFYIFHTWRTRVFQLTSSLPAPATRPASTSPR